ncbi:hypothetical protein CFC21_040352 [Triticum aestivum]|uniref:DUF6598 domain-containing protein n=2 Tax=Triticum aestivum TaxID=4565 RepID=A0A9R1FGQ5_WHEAT|nr:hypothetical protein CFC21_040352 [Triticum aestivum]CDM81907.1 unnamed protein product [Triticum aestivum]
MEVAGEAKERAGGESAERRRKEAKSSSGIYDDSATSEQIAGNEDDNSMDHYGELFLPEYLTDEEIIQEYRIGWECRCYGMFGGFKDETTIKSMLTTYKTIPHALVSHTLQVYSIKVEKPKLGWPLRVYGMVAARDHVDYNRNFLFNRTSDNCQIITADVYIPLPCLWWVHWLCHINCCLYYGCQLQEPYLTLTGPSGAILSLEPVDFEVDLKFKRGSGDGKALINQVLRYQRSPGPFGTILDNNLCTIRLHWKVFCHGVAFPLEEFVLLAFPDGDNPPMDQDGNIRLSRRVVSVDVNQNFQVSVQAYSACGSLKVPIAIGDAVFESKKDSGVTEKECDIGASCRVKIKVAWSLLIWSKRLLQG